jgi:hypothetical protein
MQCKDIPTIPILEFVEKHGGIGCNWFGKHISELSVRHAMPDNIPDKLVHAKMNKLIAKELISGCNCGCRGDYELTEKGKQLIHENNGTT